MAYCERCDRSFRYYTDFERHRANSGFHWYCDDCDRDFTSRNGLIQHYVQSPRHNYCQSCEDHFDSFGDLQDHYESDHYYCTSCNKLFANQYGLDEHFRQAHWYCAECKRLFNSESNLRAHRNSSTHKPKDVACPFRRSGCNLSFVSTSALALHLESGTCASGLSRKGVNNAIVQFDRSRMITDPSRLLTNGDTEYSATAQAWNGRAYECYLCHEEKRSLDALNKHLRSPRHDQKIYKCPKPDCALRVSTLSALLQHVESGKCGVVKFKQVQDTLDRVMNGMKRLAL